MTRIGTGEKLLEHHVSIDLLLYYCLVSASSLRCPVVCCHAPVWVVSGLTLRSTLLSDH